MMWEQIENMLHGTVLRIAENVAEFLPGLVGLLVILLVALVIAIVARGLVLRALKALQFDQRTEHAGLGGIADWSALGGPSAVIARIVMWIIVICGLLAGFSALDAALPEEFARTMFSYAPNLMAALAILIVGSVLARFLARSVLIGAVNLQVPHAGLLSAGVKWLMLVLAWTMALDHLGIGRSILPLAFAILFGGIVLTLALAVGLGSKDSVNAFLERQRRDAGERPDKLPHV
ncbi:MAG: mechanosensitive ion channel family protein [Vicinamibacterales bacterium]